MEEVINGIIERLDIRRVDDFKKHLNKCMHVSTDSGKVSHSVYENVIFKLGTFFKGYTPFLYEHGKNKKYETGAQILQIVCDELGIELDKEECFLLFHLRDLGKFRKKESDLLQELKLLWREHEDYIMSDLEFSHALKDLMRKKLINYRKGNLYLNPNMVIRYRE